MRDLAITTASLVCHEGASYSAGNLGPAATARRRQLPNPFIPGPTLYFTRRPSPSPEPHREASLDTLPFLAPSVSRTVRTAPACDPPPRAAPLTCAPASRFVWEQNSVLNRAQVPRHHEQVHALPAASTAGLLATPRSPGPARRPILPPAASSVAESRPTARRTAAAFLSTSVPPASILQSPDSIAVSPPSAAHPSCAGSLSLAGPTTSPRPLLAFPAGVPNAAVSSRHVRESRRLRSRASRLTCRRGAQSSARTDRLRGRAPGRAGREEEGGEGGGGEAEACAFKLECEEGKACAGQPVGLLP